MRNKKKTFNIDVDLEVVGVLTEKCPSYFSETSGHVSIRRLAQHILKEVAYGRLLIPGATEAPVLSQAQAIQQAPVLSQAQAIQQAPGQAEEVSLSPDEFFELYGIRIEDV